MDFGRVQGFQIWAYDTVFHQQNKATECAICRRAHLIGTDLKFYHEAHVAKSQPGAELCLENRHWNTWSKTHINGYSYEEGFLVVNLKSLGESSFSKLHIENMKTTYSSNCFKKVCMFWLWN